MCVSVSVNVSPGLASTAKVPGDRHRAINTPCTLNTGFIVFITAFTDVIANYLRMIFGSINGFIIW